MAKTLTLIYLENGKVYNENRVYSYENENLGTNISIEVPEYYENFTFIMDCQNGNATKQIELGTGATTYSLALDDSLTLTGTLELQLWATILSGSETVKVQWENYNLTINDALNISTITAESNPDIIATHTAQIADLYSITSILDTTGDGTLFLSDDGSYQLAGAIGTRDYTTITNKPKINDVELIGNKTSGDLGLEPANANIQSHISDGNVHLTATEKTNVGKLTSVGDGSTYLASDGTYKTLSATDNTKVLKIGDTMTGDLNFTGAGINDANYIDIDVLATSGAKVGRLRWNANDRSYQYDTLSDTTIISNNIGQSLYFIVRNNTGTPITKGKAVYVSGALGNRATIALARADSIVTSGKFVGLTTSTINNNTDGFVMVNGIFDGIDTNSFLAGDIIYLSESTAGGITKVRPTPPNITISIGIVTVKSGTGSISLKPVLFPGINGLSDVYTPTRTTGDILVWNGSTLRWEIQSANKTYTLSILTGDWSAGSHIETITGLTNNDLVVVQAPDSYYSDYGLSYTQSTNTITFTVTVTPLVTLNLGIAVVKAISGGAL